METVKFITLGCKVNQYDTQSIREQFLRRNYKEILNGCKADIYVVNTCTVTATADGKSRHAVRRAIRENPRAKIIVTGCYAQLNGEEIAGITGVTHIIKNQDKGRILDFLSRGCGNKEDKGMIRGFQGHTRAFLKIQDGCDNFCSYCKVPLARGRSRSRPLNEIKREACQLVKKGFKEIVLCGICLGAYGRDLSRKIDLIDVIGALEKIEGLLRIRLSSIEAGDVKARLIRKMALSKKLCRHLHIPIQSGDNEILRKMNRRYRSEDYLALIRQVKKNIPKIAVTTDVMVGFPGETERNFENTVNLVRRIAPLRVHVFPYSRRPGTFASCLKGQINGRAISARISRLKVVAEKCAFKYAKQFLNKPVEVLFERRHKSDNKLWEGYTGNYLKVRSGSAKELKNQLIKVKLKKITNDCIEAALL
ncbi:MAG: tRNA (N(6)-L-threonylcarbamoyladenosine(37)-C(2))-methylthiotransferase MtaB [Candidatus Omnitrophica bacterium]|nr:tRNA (N(6)-L-threonylcarbamoyladenosine(37)-C(2))-methylthiotransferase MtaB [Candidatus Omnitrophota bacterium]MDD5552983.1 tRNA (N(6)-L-threonylcarbamoyladenosine(37)-C(2))-methylthiotransferase MtaB [Candidatus Omnitrophota bacterium]